MPPVVATDDFDISESDFLRFLTPRAALAELEGMGYSGAVDAINQRAASGLIGVAAQTLTGTKNYRPINRKRAWVEPEAWRNANAHWNTAFWGSAQVETEIQGNSSRVRDKLRLFGVRFDPEGIEDLKQAAGLSAPPTLTVQPVAIPPPSNAKKSDEEIRQMIRTVHAEGAKGRRIPKAVRAKPGFERVQWKIINELAEGLFARVGRAGSKKE